MLKWQWYYTATDNGDTHGIRNIGIFYGYRKGGLVKDYHQAQHWYQKAKDSRHPLAQEYLDRIDAKIKNKQ